MVRCKYILMPPNKHNLASVEAVMGCEDYIIVENPACVGLGWTGLQQRSRFICNVSYWVLCEGLFWKYPIVLTVYDLWCVFLCVCDRTWHFLTCVCWVALGKTSWGSDYKIPSLKEKKVEGSRGESWRLRQSKGRERSGKGHTCAQTLPDAGMLPPNFVHSSFPSSHVTMVEISAGVRGEIVCESVDTTDGWSLMNCRAADEYSFSLYLHIISWLYNEYWGKSMKQFLGLCVWYTCSAIGTIISTRHTFLDSRFTMFNVLN